MGIFWWNLIFWPLQPWKTENFHKIKNMSNIWSNTFWSWFEPKFITLGLFAIFVFKDEKCNLAMSDPCDHEGDKGRGSKFWFFLYFGSKSSLLSPPFHRIEKLLSVCPELPARFVRVWGLQVVLAIQRHLMTREW